MNSDGTIRVLTFSHPDWGSNLVVGAGESARQLAEDRLGDSDPALLTSEPGEMSEDDFLALPDFNG